MQPEDWIKQNSDKNAVELCNLPKRSCPAYIIEQETGIPLTIKDYYDLLQNLAGKLEAELAKLYQELKTKYPWIEGFILEWINVGDAFGVRLVWKTRKGNYATKHIIIKNVKLPGELAIMATPIYKTKTIKYVGYSDSGLTIYSTAYELENVDILNIENRGQQAKNAIVYFRLKQILNNTHYCAFCPLRDYDQIDYLIDLIQQKLNYNK